MPNVYALESATESARLTKGLEVKIVIKLNYSTGSGLPAASCSATFLRDQSSLQSHQIPLNHVQARSEYMYPCSGIRRKEYYMINYNPPHRLSGCVTMKYLRLNFPEQTESYQNQL